MSFWGCIVAPGEPKKVETRAGELLHLSQACLDPATPAGASAKVLVEQGGQSYAVACLREGAQEFCALDLFLDSTEAKLAVKGDTMMQKVQDYIANLAEGNAQKDLEPFLALMYGEDVPAGGQPSHVEWDGERWAAARVVKHLARNPHHSGTWQEYRSSLARDRGPNLFRHERDMLVGFLRSLHSAFAAATLANLALQGPVVADSSEEGPVDFAEPQASAAPSPSLEAKVDDDIKRDGQPAASGRSARSDQLWLRMHFPGLVRRWPLGRWFSQEWFSLLVQPGSPLAVLSSCLWRPVATREPSPAPEVLRGRQDPDPLSVRVPPCPAAAVEPPLVGSAGRDSKNWSALCVGRVCGPSLHGVRGGGWLLRGASGLAAMGDETPDEGRAPRRAHAVAVQDHHGAGASAPSSAGRGGYPSGNLGPTGLPGMPLGLDLSFGIQGLQFENINLVGSELGESAIFSLVTSVSHITSLDLRGNRLSAAFGWRLVKAMKKKYLSLEYCNGVPLHKLRHNSISRLDLASVHNNHCMYGIEVVGAIFLAHFLRLNSSLTELDFRRNNVEKDGAKALAQSLLGNAQCQLRVVNGMQLKAVGSRPIGCDFADFRTSQLTVLNLTKLMLDDDDFVFLEEWLRRYDCVTELDISQNVIRKDGVRKLAKYVKETKTLLKLNATHLPVDFEGSAMLASAVLDNETLEEAALPLGPCNDNPDQQQMLQDFGIGLWDHPRMNRLASNTSRPPLEWANLSLVRENQVPVFPPQRSAGWPRVQMLVFMWFMVAGKPHLEDVLFGSSKNPSKEYPNCSSTPRELWPGLMAIVHDMHRTLVKLTVALPREGRPVAIELMRAISTKCVQLRTLNLLGYASTPMPLDEARLLQDWTSTGTAPRWLIEDRLVGRKLHWQALYGMLSTMEQSKVYLEKFNEISFRGPHEGGARLRDQPELTMMVLMQCLVGVAVDLQNGGGDFPQLVANLSADADVEEFCDVLRLLSKTPMVVIINFTATFPRTNNPLVETIKRQQAQLAGPLSGMASGDQVPRFTHAVVLKNNQVSERLLESLDCHAPLREFCYDHLRPALPALFKAFCSRERPLPVERIRVMPKWSTMGSTSCNAHKRFSEKRRRQLENIHAALLRSEHFQEIVSDARGTVSKDDVAAMPPDQFAALLSGVDANEYDTGERHDSKTFWRCFPSAKKFFQHPEPEEQEEEEEELFVPLPLDDDTAGELQLEKLSLCMCDLRSHLASTVRPDEWPATSRPLWDGPRKNMKPGDWDELLADTFEHEADAYDKEEGPPPFTRFHWREDLRIGTQQAALQAMGPLGTTFVDGLLHDILRSLLSPNSTLRSLDLRGCGLNRVDAEVIISLLDEQDVLQTLNAIPVDREEAAERTELRIDGSCIDRPGSGRGGSEDGMDEEEEEPSGEAFAREALEAEYVRLDEGDGLIYFEYLKPESFPSLNSLVLRRLEVPLDSTLALLTDALLSIPSLERLHLADLRLTSRGASLLLQAVTQMAPRLQSLNHLPVGQLVAQKDAQEGGALELPEGVEWNDFTLGVMARLQLWPVAAFLPPSAADGAEFRLRGPSLTDVGLKGLCVLLRHLAEQERRATAPLSRSSAPNLVRIDLSGNLQITDDTVAQLCHTLKHQSMGGSLRHSLRELNVRSCPRLRTRSSFELLNFVHHIREVLREGAASARLGSSLQQINGVDLELLQSGTGRSAGASGRSSGPPMLLRTFAEVSGRPGRSKPLLAAMSECDAHFFAGILHLYTQIPYCHVHVVVPGDLGKRRSADSPGPWGMPQNLTADGGMFQQATVSNASPFPPPQSVERQRVAAAIQAQLDSARRLFEACPFATQLRLSVVPLVDSVEDLVAEGDRTVLNGVPGTERQGDQSTFGRVKQRLQERARKSRRRRQGEADQPKRLYYQNNINSRLLHCCFRTLYGKDDTELEHAEIMNGVSTVSLPSEVDVTQVFGVATSVDMQHLDLCPAHLCRLPEVVEMPVLTHVNLNHNHLGDAGTELLFRALADANCNVVHVAVASNNIGDEGATFIASSLVKLPRLTSLELCDNFIQERGSTALADAIAGVVPPEEEDDEEPAPLEPLQVLSLDLRGNRSRELGAKRWAEVIAAHPDLKFLCLAQNGIGCLGSSMFMDLVISAVHSTVLSVLDLQDNFPLPDGVPGAVDMGPPPDEVAEELLQFLPPGEYDPAEVRRAVFIRRHRASAMPGAGEKKGRQPQQGQRTLGTRPQDTTAGSVPVSPGLAPGGDS
ncbi:unnamed protein product [Prorocentrum cordatum]|uniref:Nucleoplasmin-like domain-containing protein n=1 Tax=Prorocentrum cordatum TaxID=2364126 RepID=A0ABN9UBW2_9DINO|nr:unnamed protein product [Polarella glacialis]